MKQTIFFFGLILLLTRVSGQNQPLVANDHDSLYYSKTNFSVVDTLELWNYNLDKNYKAPGKDSVKPIAQITFWRTKPIDDGLSLEIYKQLWTPFISYEIYNLSDSTYCYYKSKLTRLISSCIPPNIGGDIFMIGNYIFLNRMVCLRCLRYDTGTDYCRPVINLILSRIDKNKVATLDEIAEQFIIKRGDINK
jgi:hypothetical protein